ncbi:MAG TPA: hypothetical protein VF881_12795 [Polyangiaceae bacterium]
MKLEDAIQALRDEGNEPPDRADETRARIMAGLQKAKRRRSKMLLMVLPIAAVLGGATASAAVASKLPAAWRSISVALRFSAPPKVNDTDAETVAKPVPAPPVTHRIGEGTAGSAESPLRGGAPPDEPSPRSATTGTSRHAAPLPKSVSKPDPATVEGRSPPTVSDDAIEPAERPADPDPLALYRRAHRLHFGTRDPAQALSAWEAYLSADPTGSFVLEARYNRALCLVRLRRLGEARAALAPFANGSFGGYRQSEARALLDTIDADGTRR